MYSERLLARDITMFDGDKVIRLVNSTVDEIIEGPREAIMSYILDNNLENYPIEVVRSDVIKITVLHKDTDTLEILHELLINMTHMNKGMLEAFPSCLQVSVNSTDIVCIPLSTPMLVDKAYQLIHEAYDSEEDI